MRCMEIFPLPLEHYNKKDECREMAGAGKVDFAFDLQLFAGEKTEEPTAKRRADALKKGQVGRSQEINAAFVMLAGFFVLKMLGSDAVEEVMNYSVYIFGNLNFDVNEESIMQLFIGIVILLAKTSIPLMLFIMVIGLAMNVAQVGFHFSTEKLSFNPGRLNPISGFGRIFSKRSLVELAKSLIKIAIIGSLVYMNLSEELWQMPKLIFVDLFAGSGGIGIEAISRGAKKSYFAENGKEAIRCIEHNLKHTHFDDKATLLKQDAISALAYHITEPADIIFADPPYGKGFDQMLLECARHATCVTEDTILIIEEEKYADFSYAEGLGFVILKEKLYKNNKHVFLKKRCKGED